MTPHVDNYLSTTAQHDRLMPLLKRLDISGPTVKNQYDDETKRMNPRPSYTAWLETWLQEREDLT